MENNRRKKGPEHIREILSDASRQWMKHRLEREFNSEKFDQLHEMLRGTPFQLIFLYIDGDTEHTRLVCLN